MERFKFLALIFFLSFLSLNINAQVYPDRIVDSLLKEGVKQIVSQNYDSAEIIFNKLNSDFPGLPLGKIFLAANKIAKGFDYAEPYDEKYITTNLESAEEISLQLLEKNENNIWHHYFLALVEGNLAYFDALNDGWLSAFSDGFNSVSAFEKCLELDKNFYESYIAIGTFAYWKSRKTEFLNWMPFVDDERDFAIRQLSIAVDSASYNAYLAMYSLIWIYIDKDDFTSAISLAKKALAEFPGSRLFKFGLARAYEEFDRNESLKLYFEILNSYPENANKTRVNEIIIKHKIAQQYSKIGKTAEALQLCDEILSIKNLTEYEQNKLKRRLERIERMQSELSEVN